MIQKLSNPQNAASLFAGWPESMIWSCLQGVMGGIYAREQQAPQAAMALLADFCFLAGIPDEELAAFKPADCKKDFMIMVPYTKDWEPLIENHFRERAKKVERYAIRKEPDVFDREKLEKAAESLPEGFQIRQIDRELYEWCREQSWCRDWVAQYPTYACYEKYGLGYAVLQGNVVVAGVSSYTSWLDGIEIQIDTKEEYRRKGLGYACASRLILTCLERGLYPSWDAHNRMSVGLAEKLGYHFDHAYTAYEIRGFGC